MAIKGNEGGTIKTLVSDGISKIESVCTSAPKNSDKTIDYPFSNPSYILLLCVASSSAGSGIGGLCVYPGQADVSTSVTASSASYNLYAKNIGTTSLTAKQTSAYNGSYVCVCFK